MPQWLAQSFLPTILGVRRSRSQDQQIKVGSPSRLRGGMFGSLGSETLAY